MVAVWRGVGASSRIIGGATDGITGGAIDGMAGAIGSAAGGGSCGIAGGTSGLIDGTGTTTEAVPPDGTTIGGIVGMGGNADGGASFGDDTGAGSSGSRIGSAVALRYTPSAPAPIANPIAVTPTAFNTPRGMAVPSS